MSTDYGALKKPARERVFELLADREWHTHAELLDVGGVRYGARLHELRREGYQLEAQEMPDHGRRYRLASLVRGVPQEKRVKALICEADVEDLLRGRMTLTAQAALKDALGSFRANKEKL